MEAEVSFEALVTTYWRWKCFPWKFFFRFLWNIGIYPVDGSRSFLRSISNHPLKMEGMCSSILVFFLVQKVFHWKCRLFALPKSWYLPTRLNRVINRRITIQKIQRLSVISVPREQRAAPTCWPGKFPCSSRRYGPRRSDCRCSWWHSRTRRPGSANRGRRTGTVDRKHRADPELQQPPRPRLLSVSTQLRNDRNSVRNHSRTNCGKVFFV
jgi:hypothetical protein